MARLQVLMLLFVLVLGATDDGQARTAAKDLYPHSSCSDPAMKPTYTPPPRGRPALPLKTAGGRLITRGPRREVQIRGINWFGFDTASMVNGLWAGGPEAATDFALIAYQLRMLGFNAVRLPFTWHDLAASITDELDQSVTATCTSGDATSLRQRLTSPSSLEKCSRKPMPANSSPVPHSVGTCNTYLTAITTSVYDRLMFVIQQFIAQGMYVVLAYSPRGREYQTYDLDSFVAAWEGLWKQVACLPSFDEDIAGRLFADVLNEPDSMGINWEAANERPGAQQLYLTTADALWKLTPGKVLFFFEGTGQLRLAPGMAWGNGFATNKTLIDALQLSDPNSFFQELVKKPYSDHVVLSPHAYPPSILINPPAPAAALWEQWRASFAYLQAVGYCNRRSSPRWTSCMKFPTVIGEVGSALQTDVDKEWLQDLAQFLNAEGEARQYNSVPLSGWMWWSYNENAGDTGGIVQNQWQDFNWEKLDFLHDHLGLRPWCHA